MKYALIVAALLMLTASTYAQTTPPPPLGSTLDPVDGVALINWANDVGADTVVAHLDRPDCPIAARGAPGDTGDPRQAVTQVPENPRSDPLCLLRPGDHVYLQRWRGGEYIDTLGPYNVLVRIWLPMIETP